eukprot:TRINITY_DN2677_c0_g1_i1.p2 TRINITY_DN2677_c0_g1~~TRINITY_DN2677_c0_g1_i1.p2  ORF type:complete len:197 (+),score=85.68 TRINITY_DN2677_c0_g1_i1:118-708(+)
MQTIPKQADYTGIDWSLNVVLETSDQQAVVFPRKLATLCDKVRPVIAAARDVKVPVPVTADTLQKVCLYLEHHSGEWPPELNVERPLRADLKDTLPAWDYEFYKSQMLGGGDVHRSDNIFLLLKAGMALGCDPLRDFACAALANIVKDVKGEQDFYGLFGVADPFSAKEKEKLYEDYEYRDSKGPAAGGEEAAPAQ